MPFSVSFSYILISPWKRPRIAWTSSGGCMLGLTMASVVNPFDFRSMRRPLNHFLVSTARCCNKTSDSISRHALLGALFEASSIRNALTRAISISVRFSTPFSLYTFGRFGAMVSALGFVINR